MVGHAVDLASHVSAGVRLFFAHDKELHLRPTRERFRSLNHETLESRSLLATLATDWGIVGDDVPYAPLNDIPMSLTGAHSYLQPRAYSAFEVDRSLLERQLRSAPLEFTSAAEANPLRLKLPRPDGSLGTFAIVEAPVMAAELAAQFPEIRTYRGFDMEDPGRTARLDLTPQGFHAQVLGAGGAYYIDPLFHLDQSVYVSYRKDQLTLDPVTSRSRQDGTADPVFDLDTSTATPWSVAAGSDDDPGPFSQRSGATLRTYRAAVAATGEYTAFHGGTVAAGQAAIVTAINRVTGIYEVEFAIRLQLVANNSSLVYTNAATDPYTNNNGVAMLAQNQTTVTSVIGSANYDIGHVFSTGGGGVASLGVVGFSTLKARGVTGLSSPIGDPFYVDYVAHEMGHQFGGDHTFNSAQGACSGNGVSASAYEPGSGSTIMAYAGICGSDDLQPNSDPYFHSRSFDQIINFVDNVIPLVGTRTSTGNTVPTADAGADYTIPAQTPFRVTGSATDADSGDALTYNWEQRDLGPFQSLAAADNGTSPLFRSWNATSDPTRYFPRLGDLLSNTLAVGEKLPTVNRTLDLRLTVRDNRSGGGGVNTDDMVVQVINTGAAFAVTAPNLSTVSWPGASLQTVTWNVAGTDSGAINTPTVNIRLSTDGGLTYPTILASNVLNDGSEEILVPSVNTSQARVMVEGAGNIFFDISNANFAITSKDVSVALGTDIVVENGVPNLSYVFTRAGSTTTALTVNFSVGGTAAFGVDYSQSGASRFTATSGTVRIPIGATTATVLINPTGDGQIESEETVVLTLLAGTNYTVGGSSISTGTIQNDDAPFTALLSLTADATVRNSNGSTLAADDSDILTLTAAGDGSYTYSRFFDGSDVGLTTAAEDMDAFDVLNDGSIVVSLVGAYSVNETYLTPGIGSGGTLIGSGEDLLRFVPSTLGDATTGSWSLYFDGSLVGLTGAAESVDSVSVLDDGRILLSTAGAVSVPGVTGVDSDLIAFTPTALGTATAGTWTVFFDGSDVGLTTAAEDLDGLFVEEVGAGEFELYFSTRGALSVPGLTGANEDVAGFHLTTEGAATAGSFGPQLAFDGSVYGLASQDVDGWVRGAGVIPRNDLNRLTIPPSGYAITSTVLPRGRLPAARSSLIDRLFADDE